jgi:hypothetical protein
VKNYLVLWSCCGLKRRKGNLLHDYLSKRFAALVLGALVGWFVVGGGSCFAEDISSLPWFNNLDCAPWTYNGTSETITITACSEFHMADDGFHCGTETSQIVAAASNTNNFTGGVGIRQWVGTGADATDGFTVILPYDLPSINIRWYERYQSGFAWNTVNHHKDLYIWNIYNETLIPTPFHDKPNAIAYQVAKSGSVPLWNLAGPMPNVFDPGDGLWHYYELHATQSGIVQMYVDGTLITNGTFSPPFTAGFRYVQFGSNVLDANNSPCAAIDYDDLAISEGTYIGPVCDVRPRVGMTYYTNLQAAYNDPASTGGTIQAHAGTFMEGLTADADKAVTLDGGYDCNYTPNTGNVTTITGGVQITAGTLNIKNVVIKLQ